MSRTIDERVVEMRFDNKQFEDGIEDTIESLDKLTRSLDLGGASKGLEGIGDASKGLGVDMNGLSSVVETVGSKFSAMKVVAITALANITNSAVNAGKRILSSLTVEPVSMGFKEYELKMGSVQTIMAGTGESLETVNKYLEELNAYSDRTIYSFSDMTNNIGKFTNAGVKLEDAVTAIKGVSNVAALSGANANEASRAMYNFSQALSSGYVKLIDWKSIENANMATVGFKDELIKTAIELGTVTDAGDGMYKTLSGKTFNATKNFNDVLQEQWMTTDVLVKTLGRYTDETTDLGKNAYAAAQDIKTFSMLLDTLKEAAQSGWAQTWEIVFGDFEEAKKLWTDVNKVVGDIISSTSNARNEMLKGWKELGGRTALIDALANAFHGVVAVVKPIGDALKEIFPPITAKQLFEATEKFKMLTEDFRKFLTENERGKKLINNVKNIFKGLFSAIDIGVQLVLSLAKAFGTVLKFLAPVGEGILALFGGIGAGITDLRDFIKSSKIFDDVLGSIANTLGVVIVGIRKFVTGVTNWVKKVFKISGNGAEDFADRVETRFKPLAKLGETIKKIFDGIANFFKKAGGVILGIGKKIGDGIADLFGGIFESIKNADFNTVLDIVNGGLLAGLIVGVKKFLDRFSGIVKSGKKGIDDFVKGFKKILGSFNDILGSVKDAINTFTASVKIKMLKEIATSIAILAAAVIAMSLVDSAKLAASLGVMTGLFVDLFGTMTLFQKLMGKDGFVVMEKLTTQLMGIAIATLVLAIAVTKLSKLSFAELGNGILGISSALLFLTASAKALSSKEVQYGAKGMMSLGVSVLILAFAVERFSKLSLESLAKGLGSVAVVLGSLVAFTKLADSKKMGVGLVGLAAGILILSMAIKNVSDLNLAQVGTGLLALAGAIGIVIGAAWGLPKDFGMKALKLILLAQAISAVGAAFTLFARLKIDQVGSGLLGLAGTLGIIIGFIYAIPKEAKSQALTLIKMAAAITTLAGAMAVFGTIPLDNIGRGLLGLGGSLAIIIGALWALPKDTLLRAIGISAVATSLYALVPALAMLGLMKPEAIVASLLAIAGVLTIFGVAVYALQGKELTLLAIAGALTALSVACVAISAAVTAMSVAIATMATLGAAASTVIIASLTAIVAMIPVIIENVGKGIAAFFGVIATSGEALVGMFSTILGSLITAVSQNATQMFDLVRMIFDRILGILIEMTPRLMEWLGMVVNGLLVILENSIPRLMAIVSKLFNGVLTFLRNSVPQLVATATQMVLDFLHGIRDAIPLVIMAGAEILVAFADGVLDSIDYLINAGFQMIIDFVNGVAEAIRGNTQPLLDAFGNLADSIIDGLTQGLRDGASRVVNKARELGEAAWQGIKDVLGIHSPSKKFREVGVFSGEGLALGLEDMESDVNKAARGVGKGAVNALSDAVKGIADVVSSDIDTTPTIRPVIDLSDVKSGEKKLSKMLGQNKTISVDSATVRAAYAAHSMNPNEVNAGTNPANQNGGTTFTFTQNNYSPKALSKTDIYRQTKNQISVAKEALKAH